MGMVEDAKKRFVTAIGMIDQEEQAQAYRKAWSKPLRFYWDHEPEEAAQILIEENKEV